MHPYLRAYMAGIALPTLIAPIVAAAVLFHHPGESRDHLQAIAVFPIALVPNAWGLWNVLYIWLRQRREIPIGLHGAVLVLLVLPAAFVIQLIVGRIIWNPDVLWVGVPTALAAYYLAWKYVVARFNIVLGIG